MDSEAGSDTLGASHDRRWLPIVSFYVILAVWGVLQVFAYDNGAAYWLTGVALASTASTWVMMDAKQRRQPMPLGFLFPVFIVWPISVPMYMIFSRRLRGVGLVIINVLAIVFVIYIFFYGTILLTWGPSAILPE